MKDRSAERANSILPEIAGHARAHRPFFGSTTNIRTGLVPPDLAVSIYFSSGNDGTKFVYHYEGPPQNVESATNIVKSRGYLERDGYEVLAIQSAPPDPTDTEQHSGHFIMFGLPRRLENDVRLRGSR